MSLITQTKLISPQNRFFLLKKISLPMARTLSDRVLLSEATTLTFQPPQAACARLVPPCHLHETLLLTIQPSRNAFNAFSKKVPNTVDMYFLKVLLNHRPFVCEKRKTYYFVRDVFTYIVFHISYGLPHTSKCISRRTLITLLQTRLKHCPGTLRRRPMPRGTCRRQAHYRLL